MTSFVVSRNCIHAHGPAKKLCCAADWNGNGTELEGLVQQRDCAVLLTGMGMGLSWRDRGMPPPLPILYTSPYVLGN